MDTENSSEHCEHCIVRQINALQAMNKRELKEVSNAKVTKLVKKGETIFKEGERLNGVFCIRSGATKLSKLSESGTDQIIKIAGKGEVIGKRSIITEEPIHIEATALNDMEVCFIPKNKILEPLKKNDKFNLKVLKRLTADLKEAETIIMDRSQKSTHQRLAEILIYLKEKHGEDQEGYLKLVLSREELASLVGTVKETCIRSLSDMKKRGLIKIVKKDIAIVSQEGLKQIIEGKRYRN